MFNLIKGIWLDITAHPCNLLVERRRQDDCKFEANKSSSLRCFLGDVALLIHPAIQSTVPLLLPLPEKGYMWYLVTFSFWSREFMKFWVSHTKCRIRKPFPPSYLSCWPDVLLLPKLVHLIQVLTILFGLQGIFFCPAFQIAVIIGTGCCYIRLIYISYQTTV